VDIIKMGIEYRGKVCNDFVWLEQEQVAAPFNPLNAELNPICYLPALLGAHCFLHVNRI